MCAPSLFRSSTFLVLCCSQWVSLGHGSVTVPLLLCVGHRSPFTDGQSNFCKICLAPSHEGLFGTRRKHRKLPVPLQFYVTLTKFVRDCSLISCTCFSCGAYVLHVDSWLALWRSLAMKPLPRARELSPRLERSLYLSVAI